MQRKSLEHMQCPVARSVDHVGDWWNILILRDASQGLTRFDQFQKNLGVGSAILAKRLQSLVDSGMLERRRYSERPPRDEYLLTARGRDFRPVLWSLIAFGNRQFAPEGEAVFLVDRETGVKADPILVDRVSGRPMTPAAFRTTTGPVAGEALRRRHIAANETPRRDA